MEDIINNIINKNKKIFGINPEINKINIGFTNTIYSIDNKYIVKICSDINNEEQFENEINFYNSNKDNKLIPKLYISSTDKKEIPYMYEIIEKIEGTPLYNVWHVLNELQREEIIKQLCDAMKQIHSNIGKSYDWCQKFKHSFMELYEKAKEQTLFNESDQNILNNVYLKFDEYLEASEFVLVHNDLHFDNIFYDNEKIQIIDFERAIYAPKDFELDIIYRMVRKPWKFASEETEKYTKINDYENIMNYIEKYYPELINIDNLYKRLAIYDMVYNLKHYINDSWCSELKEDILNDCRIILQNESRK